MYHRDRVLNFLKTVETATTEDISKALNLRAPRVHEACQQLGDRVCKRTRSSAGGQNVWYLNPSHSENDLDETPVHLASKGADDVRALVEELRDIWEARQGLAVREAQVMSKIYGLSTKGE